MSPVFKNDTICSWLFSSVLNVFTNSTRIEKTASFSLPSVKMTDFLVTRRAIAISATRSSSCSLKSWNKGICPRNTIIGFFFIEPLLGRDSGTSVATLRPSSILPDTERPNLSIQSIFHIFLLTKRAAGACVRLRRRPPPLFRLPLRGANALKRFVFQTFARVPVKPPRLAPEVVISRIITVLLHPQFFAGDHLHVADHPAERGDVVAAADGADRHLDPVLGHKLPAAEEAARQCGSQRNILDRLFEDPFQIIGQLLGRNLAFQEMVQNAAGCGVSLKFGAVFDLPQKIVLAER